MALEYQLIVAGGPRPPAMLERLRPAVGAAAADPSGAGLWLDLDSSHGFRLGIYPDDDSFVDADPGHGEWTWEPGATTDLTFRFSATDPEPALRHLLEVVAQVLRSGSEDLALLFNREILFLNRVDGVVTKFRREDLWDLSPFADEVVPG